MLQGADDAEAVEEASETSLVTRRIWGPVCAEHTNSIGAAAAVERLFGVQGFVWRVGREAEERGREEAFIVISRNTPEHVVKRVTCQFSLEKFPVD